MHVDIENFFSNRDRAEALSFSESQALARAGGRGLKPGRTTALIYEEIYGYAGGRTISRGGLRLSGRI